MCLALAFVAAGCDDNNSTDDADAFAATPMNGAAVVPPNGSDATGSATFDLSGDSVQYTIQLNGITGVTLVHLHSGAVAGSGPSRVQLFVSSGTGAVNGTLTSDSFAAGDVQGISFDDLIDEMRNGQVYIDVHTLGMPDGEVRGQVQPVN
jgi:hypothetical protein